MYINNLLQQQQKDFYQFHPKEFIKSLVELKVLDIIYPKQHGKDILFLLYQYILIKYLND